MERDFRNNKRDKDTLD